MAEKQEHTAGSYRLDSECGAVIVTGKDGDVQVCACGPEDDVACHADAERIRLALTCHDDLLAACKAALPYVWMRSKKEHGNPLVDELHAVILAAIAIAKAKGE